MILDEILNDLYLKIHTVDDARDLVDEIMWREINAHVAAERSRYLLPRKSRRHPRPRH